MQEKKNKDKLIQHISIQSKIKRSGIKDRVEMIVQNLTNKVSKQYGDRKLQNLVYKVKRNEFGILVRHIMIVSTVF